MLNLTINDYTQKIILSHLETTEWLISKVASKLSNANKNANIIAMPDLGFPRNVGRILGGFYTGALYSWDSNIPIIPIDATVNSCGVSVFKLKYEIEKKEDFIDIINNGIQKSNNSSYDWNFNEGNHFINYGIIKNSSTLNPGNYIVMHSSASEFKKYNNGLYPIIGNWYYNNIKILTEGNRYIRYICGNVAENFFKISSLLTNYNKIRHQYFAEALFGEKRIEQELLYMPHYGMPNINSVAIGCNYIDNYNIYLLLTTPNKPSYFIRPKTGGNNEILLDKKYTLSPHGLGMSMNKNYVFSYSNNCIYFNKKKFRYNDKLSFDKDIIIRDCFFNNLSHENAINSFINTCPGEICGEFEPIFSYNSSI